MCISESFSIISCVFLAACGSGYLARKWTSNFKGNLLFLWNSISENWTYKVSGSNAFSKSPSNSNTYIFPWDMLLVKTCDWWWDECNEMCSRPHFWKLSSVNSDSFQIISFMCGTYFPFDWFSCAIAAVVYFSSVKNKTPRLHKVQRAIKSNDNKKSQYQRVVVHL